MKLASRQPLPVSELEVAISAEARLRRRYARRGRAIPRLRVVWSASTVFAVVLGALSFLYATSRLLLALTVASTAIWVLSITSMYVLEGQRRRLAGLLPDAMNSISRIRLASRR